MTAAVPRSRESYAELALYTPDRRPCAIDLSDNTNLWGMPPAAEQAIRDAAGETITRYPDVYAHALKRALAEYTGVDPCCIATGCGSDDVLDSAIRAFGNPGDRIAIPDPSFAMLPAFARMNGVEPVLVPLIDAYDVDAAATVAIKASIVYLCSPNNPTGVPFRRASMERVVRDGRGIVIIDEAYAEFSDDTMIEAAMESRRVLIVRTMSKAFGLAGLRIGYGIGHPSLVAEVEKSRGPYKVNAIAERAAVAALGAGLAWVRERIGQASELRAAFTRSLRALALDPLPSQANFVLVPMPGASDVAAAMRARGVAVRAFDRLAAPPSSALARTGGSALRITVGPGPLMERALGALREVLS